jgi:hypothetical protein
VDPVPDPLLLRKSGSAGNRTWDLCDYSQEPLPLDHRGVLHEEWCPLRCSAGLLPVSCKILGLAYPLTLKMEAVYSSEMLVKLYYNEQHHGAED